MEVLKIGSGSRTEVPTYLDIFRDRCGAFKIFAYLFGRNMKNLSSNARQVGKFFCNFSKFKRIHI